ncbi:hypothetical protein FQA39_LY11444 [Lamprigera yunnana]|nr:hypothetical protein FQA39_LY11444 [Lamprigera yunnana]
MRERKGLSVEVVKEVITKIMYRGLPDAAPKALANMSDSYEDFEASKQDDDINGEDTDYKISDFQADSDDAVDVQ